MSVPTTKESHMLRSISDLHFTDKSQPLVFQSACGIALSQVRDAIWRRGHVRAFYGGDMSPHFERISAASATQPLRRGQFPDSLAPAILNGLRQFDDSMADRCRNPRALW